MTHAQHEEAAGEAYAAATKRRLEALEAFWARQRRAIWEAVAAEEGVPVEWCRPAWEEAA